MSSSIRASKTKPSRHVRFGDDGEKIEEVAGHSGLRASDIPTEDVSEEEYEGDEEFADGEEEDEEEEEYSDGEDLGEDMVVEEIVERLDVISQSLVTEDGDGIADILADISSSLRTITKLLYASHRGNHRA